jgi:DNA repair exonuclease SbcCD ATPase subunit
LIGVDEEDFLIATDIDKLIEILSTKKEVEVGKLSRDLKMNRKEVEKWLHILEEEGVITLVHRMGSLHAVWVMKEKPEPQRKAAPQKAAPTPPRAIISSKPQEIPRQTPKPKVEEEEEEGPVDLELEHLRPISADRKSLFSSIMPSSKSKRPAASAAPSSKKEQRLIVEETSVYSTPSYMPPQEPLPPMKKKLEKSEFLDLPAAQTGKLKGRLDEYLTLIKSSKEELKGLDGEKERMHREGYLSLEKEFEASLENLEYALLEKEKRIIEARERISTLPGRIGEIDQMQEAFSKTDSEARTLLSKTKSSIDKNWKALSEVSHELSGELEKGEQELMRDRNRMVQMRDMLQSIEHHEAELNETLTSARAALEDMEAKVRQVEETVQEAGDSKNLAAERVDHIQSSLERRMGQLEQLRAELERVEKVEQWFRQYSEDYSAKMDELQSYVSESQGDLEKIKKAAELEYVKKYLSELDKIEGGYREKLGSLEFEEASIDEKTSEVRNRIKSLMHESAELMSKYRQMGAEGDQFNEMVSTAREGSRAHREMVEEKSDERRRLMQDADNLKRRQAEDKKRKKK